MPSGRVEAQITVPSGGASVSASIGAATAAQTVTVPAGNYYLTAAGGVSSLLTVLQQQLNDNVQPYPQTAAAMQAAVGYGTWSHGWLMNEASGNLAPAFGAITLTASSLTYGTTGPRSGIDKAIGFDATTDNADGGNNFNVTNLTDLCFAWVGYNAGNTGADLFSKWNGGPGWFIYPSSAVDIAITSYFGGATVTSATLPTNAWYVAIAVIDRGAGKIRIATKNLNTLVSSVSTNTAVAANDLTNAGSFRIGAPFAGITGVGADTAHKIAAVYVGTGVGAAANMSTNLSTAIDNFANAILSQWAVSMSTSTGLVGISHSFWPCAIAWTSTALRDVLGFAYDFDYPQTAAQMATALGGYGTFTSGAGYLCNEASGDLASVFGTPATLTASSLTYGALGARGGADKAIGFDAGTDYASGGDVFDVGATDDLIVAWVARHAATPTVSGDILFSKYTAAGGGWQVYAEVAGGTHAFYCASTVPAELLNLTGVSLHVGAWHCGIAVIDRSTGKARYGTISLLDGTVSVSSETAIAATSMANASNFQVGDRADVASAAPQDCKIAAFYVVTGSGVATGLSANLSTALSNFAAYMKGQTSTRQARGLWLPESHFNLDDDPRTAPVQNDGRQTQSPTGQVLGLVGNEWYEHTNARWDAVPLSKYREASATYANASLEVFWRDTQAGTGHSWFKPYSPLQIYYSHAGVDTAVGSDESISGWYVTGVGGIRDVAKKREENWTGLWTVTLPRLVSSG